jgi:prophage regulatory protein
MSFHTSDNLLSIKSVMLKIEFGPTKIYDMIAKGEFPAPIKIGAASRWSAADVNNWVEDQKRARCASGADRPQGA